MTDENELLIRIRKAFPPVESIAAGVLHASVDLEAAQQVVDELDRLAGGSDVRMAKASALCRMMQMKSAEKVIDQVLAEDSRHLDAAQKKAYWDEWPLVFDLPEWNESMTSVEGLYRSRLGPLEPSGVRIYLARHGITPACVVVQSIEGLKFDRGIRPEMESRLEIKVVETPHGPVAAYYVVLVDDPSSPFRREAFLNLSVDGAREPFAGFWLLRRLAEQGEYFVVFADGSKVLYNKRHQLKERPAADVNRIAASKPRLSPEQYMAAMKWFMDHVPMDGGPAPEKQDVPTFETTPFKHDRMMCDKDLCCGNPKVIERGQGYLYVSEQAVEFRKDCPTMEQVKQKLMGIVSSRLRSGGNPALLMNPDALWEEFAEQMDPVPMCEEGARAKKLDLNVAREDAVRWWNKGVAPLRPTPRTGPVPDEPRVKKWPCGHPIEKGTSTCWKCRVPKPDPVDAPKGGGCLVMLALGGLALVGLALFFLRTVV